MNDNESKKVPTLVAILCSVAFLLFMMACNIMISDLMLSPTEAVAGEVTTKKIDKITILKEFYDREILSKLEEKHKKPFEDQKLIINFWASWCAPCLREFPQLVTLHKEIFPEYQIIGINVDSGAHAEKDAQKIERKFAIPFPSIRDPHTKLMDDLGLENLPTTLVINKGVIKLIHEKETQFLGQQFRSHL